MMTMTKFCWKVFYCLAIALGELRDVQGSFSFANKGVACKTPRFRQLEGEELQRALGNGIEFNESQWVSNKHDDAIGRKEILPKRLLAPSFVQAFEYNKDDAQLSYDDSSASPDLQELGKTASDIIESNQSQTGALLFRNLPIDTPAEFRRFIDAVECWQPHKVLQLRNGSATNQWN